MPVNLALIEERGGNHDALKKIFETPDASQKPRVLTLLKRIRMRAFTGATKIMDRARYYHSLDKAFDVALNSVSQTMVRQMITDKVSPAVILQQLKNYGISPESFLHPKVVNGEIQKMPTGDTMAEIDVPAFIAATLNIVSYYTSIRKGKIVTDVVGQEPLHKYEPSRLTTKDRLRCDIITQLVARMNTALGNRADEADAIEPALKYGSQIAFPMESWFQEKQIRTDANGKAVTKKVKKTVKKEDGTEVMEEVDEDEKVVLREGIRWFNPHITRWYIDPTQPLYKLNTDTGPAYGGYFTVWRYSDIADNDDFWNKERISVKSDHWYLSSAWDVYATLYPCTIHRPQYSEKNNLREDGSFKYVSTEGDQGVPITPHFEKLNPKTVGLFNYDADVWMRFLLAGETVIHAEVFGFRPMTAYLYDNDSRKDMNTGLAAELIPFQDRVTQFCSNYTLAVKQNGLNITFYNSNIIKTDDIKKMENSGEKLYRSRTFIPYAPHENEALGGKVQEAFFTPQFARMNAEEYLRAVQSEIELMERVLGFTAQEVGAQATHEQSSKEVDLIATNASNRTRFTEMALYDAQQSKKVAYYDALMNYATDEVVATITVENELDAKELKELGFEVEHDPSTSKAGIRGKKSLLVVEDFASARDGENRTPDSKIAAAMIQIMPMIFNNPVLVQQVGAKQLLKRVNEMLNWAGIPGDWRFDPDEASTPEDVQKQTEELMKAVPQIVQQEIAKFMEALKTSALDPLAQKLQQTEQAVEATAQAVGQQAQKLEAENQQQNQAIQQEAQAIGQLSQEVQTLDKKMDEVGGAVTAIVQHEAEAQQAAQAAAVAPAPLDPTQAAVIAAAQGQPPMA